MNSKTLSLVTYKRKKIEIRYREGHNVQNNDVFSVTHFRCYCARSYARLSKDALNPHRPNRHLLKCDCNWYMDASHTMLVYRSGRDTFVVKMVGLCSDHTNGCTGENEEMN